MNAVPVAVCPKCQTQLAPTLLSCPSCQRLVHATRLNEIAAQAEAARKAGDSTREIELWRESLELLPPATTQYQRIRQRVDQLSQQIDAGTAPQVASTTPKPKSVGMGVAVASILVFLATKGKLLLMGLANASTMFSMVLALGVYWTIWGWRFALGLVLSIYVHEMGHVALLRKYGFRASAPMFIPGVGAVIRSQQRTVNAVEDARIGLAGPIWGLGAALVAAVAWGITGNSLWGAIATVGAWINLFNLIPLFPLDGGRGFRALSRPQAWLVIATMATMWAITHEGMLILLLIVGVLNALAKRPDTPGDKSATFQFVGLLVILSLMTWMPLTLPSGERITRGRAISPADDSPPTQPSPDPHPQTQQNR